MKEMRESGDILKSLKELTTQQMALTNEIMRLKRELAGRPALSAREYISDIDNVNSNVNGNVNGATNITNVDISNTLNTTNPNHTNPNHTNPNHTNHTNPNPTNPINTKKRGRGRPRKDAETVSSLAPTYSGNDDFSHEVVRRINDDTTNIINEYSKSLCYVLEGGELFLHNPDNGRLFDIETRAVVGRYNLYLDRIDWL